MKKSLLLNALEVFFEQNLETEKPVLLAFSGGADSSSLLDVLLTYRNKTPIELHVAHIDHGWRKESTSEADQLRKKFDELHIPFHSIRLYPEHMKGNLEAACREERLKFFSDLTLEYGFQGVLTAHHADDLAETVLQHVFEGASLPYMSGILPITTLGNVTMWRPFLEVTKKDILEHLEKNKISYLNDSTNVDPRFMRARFRTNIIPQLSKEFGKEIVPSLVRIAFESFELRHYLDKNILRFRKHYFNSPLGLYFDLSYEEDLSPIEIRFLLRRIAEQNGSFLPHAVVDEITYLLVSNAANKQVNIGPISIKVDRKRVFFPTVDFIEMPQEPLILKEGNHSYGDWLVEVTKHPITNVTTSWTHMWQGHNEVVLPKGDYYLRTVSPQDRLHTNKVIGDWWTDKQVPSFLRYFMPAIWQNDRIAHEFLTGKYTLKSQENEGIKVKLFLNLPEANP